MTMSLCQIASDLALAVHRARGHCLKIACTRQLAGRAQIKQMLTAPLRPQCTSGWPLHQTHAFAAK